MGYQIRQRQKNRCDVESLPAIITDIDTAIDAINVKTWDMSGTYKYAYANLAADGNIVALVAGKKIRVYALVIQAISSSVGTIETGAGAGAIKLKWDLNSREGMVLPWCPVGWFETVAGEALYADFSTAAETMFVVVYSEV